MLGQLQQQFDRQLILIVKMIRVLKMLTSQLYLSW